MKINNVQKNPNFAPRLYKIGDFFCIANFCLKVLKKGLYDSTGCVKCYFLLKIYSSKRGYPRPPPIHTAGNEGISHHAESQEKT